MPCAPSAAALLFPAASAALLCVAAAALLAVVLLERRIPGSGARRAARTAVRVAVLLAVVAALADPRLSRDAPAPARLVLVVDEAAFAAAGAGARADLEREAAGATRDGRAALTVREATGSPARLAAALASARLAIAADERGAVVVASDGRADPAGVREAVAALALDGVPVRARLVGLPAPPAASPPSAAIEALAAPREARGPFAVRAVVRAPAGATASLLVDGADAGTKALPDASRGAEVAFDPVTAPAGVREIALRVADAAGTTLALSRTLVTVTPPPRVRFVTRDGGDVPLRRALEAQGFVATLAVPGRPLADDGPAGPAPDVVVLDADAAAALPRGEATALAERVRGGLGLLLLAGRDATAWAALARGPLGPVLPVTGRAPPAEPPADEAPAPPPEEEPKPTPPPEKPPPGPGLVAERRPEDALPISLLLVIDRSYSMKEDQKLAMAVVAAEEAAGALSPEDRVGVLSFADEPTLDTPMRRVGAPSLTALVRRLEPGGNTNIYGALAKAEAVIGAEASPIRHVILLTDGRQTGVAYFGDLVDRMTRAGITITSVALGYDADDRLLKRLGHYRFARTARDLPRIVTLDTTRVVAARRERVEGAPRVDDPSEEGPDPAPSPPSPPSPPSSAPDRPPRPPPKRPDPRPVPASLPLVRVRPHEALAGLDPAALPRVGPPRPSDLAPAASALLAREDGLLALAAGRPGLGRAIAWTLPSDDGGANAWRAWPQLAAQVVRSLLPVTPGGDAPALRVASRPSGDVLHVSFPEGAADEASAALLRVERVAADGRKPGAFLGVEDGEAVYALPPAPDGAVARVSVGPVGAAPTAWATYLPRREPTPPAGADPEALSRATGLPISRADDADLWSIPPRDRRERRPVFAWFASLALLLLPLDVALHRRARAAPSRAPDAKAP